jgi:hypothetical protein
MNSSTTDIGLPLPTDLTSEMSDALVSLLKNIDEMDNDTAAATTNSEFPLDLSSYPQFDLFSTWLNDPSPVDYQSLPPLPPLPPLNDPSPVDYQSLPPLPPFN